ncbi:MAG: hypothetical protein SVM79_04785 [Chloroflexota bacterium]|nr:hypothetical protein [Chloroflexota bacterium]
MDQASQPNTILCPNKHINPEGSLRCDDCGLPVIDYKQEKTAFLKRMADKTIHIVPHINGILIGTGTIGKQIVTDFYNLYGSENSWVSFLNIDSIESANITPEIKNKGVKFHQYEIGEIAMGGTIYCGRGEQAALQDRRLESYLHLSGIRREDANQAMFITSALGGGTGSGVGPVVVNLCRTVNPDASIAAITITPSRDEADHTHLNAYYGLSRLLSFDLVINANMIVLLDYDRLRQIRGVGRSGEDLKTEKVAAYLLRLMELNLYQSGIIRMCRMSKGMKIQVFVPCLAIGRSMEIFGNLTNVLESAGIFPMAKVNMENVMASYLILRVPSGFAKHFPEGMVAKEFDDWNRRHVPSLSSSLVQILQTDEESDRIDACIFLGGDNLSTAIGSTINGYQEFKAYLEKSERWEECGLTPEKLLKAEQTIASYDETMQELRSNKTGA